MAKRHPPVLKQKDLLPQATLGESSDHILISISRVTFSVAQLDQGLKAKSKSTEVACRKVPQGTKQSSRGLNLLLQQPPHLVSLFIGPLLRRMCFYSQWQELVTILLDIHYCSPSRVRSVSRPWNCLPLRIVVVASCSFFDAASP